MFEDVKNQMNSQAPSVPPLPPSGVNPQASPMLSANQPTANQLANLSAATRPKHSSRGKLVAILIIFILVLGVAGLGYWYWQNNQDQIKAVLLPLAGIKTGEINIDFTDPFASSTQELDVTTSTDELDYGWTKSMQELLSDYNQVENWPSLFVCYLSKKNPEAKQYFPEGKIREQYDFSNASSTNSQENAYMESICSVFDDEAYDFALATLKTDADNDTLNLFLETIYHSSDASVDTDNDSYSDLTEISTNHNPNDTLANEIKTKMSNVEKMLENSDFNIGEAKAVCQSLDSPTKDMCLVMISEKISDISFCTSAGFSPYYTYFLNCESNIYTNQALQGDDPQKCLKIAGSDRSYCLAWLAEKNQSLVPCTASKEDFSSCAGTALIDEEFILKDTGECDKYKSQLEEFYYNKCLVKAGLAEDNY